MLKGLKLLNSTALRHSVRRAGSSVRCFSSAIPAFQEHLLTNVERKIEAVRQEGLLGGGEKRIEAQHNKVLFSTVLCFCHT
jgi:hypothetical protein